MNYDCSCDYESPSFYRRTLPTARAPYRCYECAGPIPAGEQYERVTAKWDGYIDTCITCRRCLDIRTWVKNNVPCFCWAHGNLHEDTRTAVDEAIWRAPEETKGLKFGLLRRLVALDKHNLARRAA